MKAEDLFRKELGLNIKKYRQSKNLTGKDLAGKTGISPAYISEIERGLSDVSFRKLLSISRALDISIEQFLPLSEKVEIQKNSLHKTAFIMAWKEGYRQCLSDVRDNVTDSLKVDLEDAFRRSSLKISLDNQ